MTYQPRGYKDAINRFWTMVVCWWECQSMSFFDCLGHSKALKNSGLWEVGYCCLHPLLSIFGCPVLSRIRAGVGGHSNIGYADVCLSLQFLQMHASVVASLRDAHCYWSLVYSQLQCRGCGCFFLCMWSNRACPICQGLGHSWKLGVCFYLYLRWPLCLVDMG